MDSKLYGKCFKCKRNRFFVAKRGIKLPIGDIAKSRELFCNKCFKQLQAELEK